MAMVMAVAMVMAMVMAMVVVMVMMMVMAMVMMMVMMMVMVMMMAHGGRYWCCKGSTPHVHDGARARWRTFMMARACDIAGAGSGRCMMACMRVL